MKHILIVEDELKLARLQVDYLHNSGFDTNCLSNGLEVLPWLKATPTDLILLDLMLPGRDGLDICREIRSFSAVPIIRITARIEEIDRLLGLELGADDYILVRVKWLLVLNPCYGGSKRKQQYRLSLAL